MPDIQITTPPFRRHPDPLIGVAVAVDNGGNEFTASAFYRVNSNYTHVILDRRGPAGDATWNVVLPYVDTPQGRFPWKIDGISMVVSGDGLLFNVSAHEPKNPRDYGTFRFLVRGVGVVPYPAGRPQLGASDLSGVAVFTPDGGPPPPPPDPNPNPGFTVDDILDAFKAEMAVGGELRALHQQVAKNGAVDAIGRDVVPKLTELKALVQGIQVSLPDFLRTPDALLGTLKDGLYSWAKDRGHESTLTALREYFGKATGFDNK